MITAAEIKVNVATKQNWTERALVVLHDHQTEDEKVARDTKHDNGVGFSGVDAEILSSFAEQVKAGRHLTSRQLAIAFKKLPKYAGQLFKMVVEKATISRCSCGSHIVADDLVYRCLGCGYTAPRKEAA